MSSAASSRNLGSGGIRLDRSLVSNLTTAVIFAAQAILLVLAVVLLSRWIGGAFSRPAPGLAVVVATIVVVACATLCRSRLVPGTPYSVLRTHRSRTALVGMIGTFAVPGLTTVLILASLAAPGTSALALTLAWLIFLAVEVVSWFAFYQRLAPFRGGLMPRAVAARQPVVESGEALAPNAVQQMTRIRDENGAETIAALLRVNFAAGERLQVVHLAFCPPLERVPTVALEQLDGLEVELRTTNVQTFGTRIEVRLIDEASDSRSAVVQVYAATAPSEPAASDHLP